LLPLAAVGIGSAVPTNDPFARRSSMNTGVDAFESAGVGDPGPTRTTRKVSVLQVGVASQAFEPSAAQSVPGGRAGFEGAPAVHTSFVQTLPSTGRSVSSLADVTPPAPSHTAFLQLPVASGSAAVPACVLMKPQVWSLAHARGRQIVSVPGQSPATTHCTQTPALHSLPLLSVHVVPLVLGVKVGTPLTQVSVVQLLWSLGRSVSSFTAVTPPRPSHCAFLQLPVASGSAAVPGVALEKPQVFWFPQTRL